MEGNVHLASRERAATQWEQLYDAVRQCATVELVEPRAGSPDMVFTANAGLVHDGVVALSSFRHPERQGEEPHFRKWFDDSGFAVREIPVRVHSKVKATRSSTPMARNCGPGMGCAATPPATPISGRRGASRSSPCDW